MRSRSLIFAGASPFTTAGGSSPFSTLSILWVSSRVCAVWPILFFWFFDADVCSRGMKASPANVRIGSTTSNTTPSCAIARLIGTSNRISALLLLTERDDDYSDASENGVYVDARYIVWRYSMCETNSCQESVFGVVP